MATFGLSRKTLKSWRLRSRLALSKLELPDRQDPLAVVLAKFDIELAKQGERDPEKLCNAALKMLEK